MGDLLKRETINGARTVKEPNQKVEEKIKVNFSYCKLRI